MTIKDNMISSSLNNHVLFMPFHPSSKGSRPSTKTNIFSLWRRLIWVTPFYSLRSQNCENFLYRFLQPWLHDLYQPNHNTACLPWMLLRKIIKKNVYIMFRYSSSTPFQSNQSITRPNRYSHSLDSLSRTVRKENKACNGKLPWWGGNFRWRICVEMFKIPQLNI